MTSDAARTALARPDPNCQAVTVWIHKRAPLAQGFHIQQELALSRPNIEVGK